MIAKLVLAIVDVLMTGAVGAARSVVTGSVFEGVSPPLLPAVTVTW